MKLWLMQTCNGPEIINPNGIIFDEEYVRKWKLFEFEIPNNVTDYIFDRRSMSLYYVVDGKIHIQ